MLKTFNKVGPHFNDARSCIPTFPISPSHRLLSKQATEKMYGPASFSLCLRNKKKRKRQRKERENHHLLLNLSFDSILFRVRYCRERGNSCCLSSAYDPHRRDCGLVLRWVRKGQSIRSRFRRWWRRSRSWRGSSSRDRKICDLPSSRMHVRSSLFSSDALVWLSSSPNWSMLLRSGFICTLRV